jgi:hypothetical protein
MAKTHATSPRLRRRITLAPLAFLAAVSFLLTPLLYSPLQAQPPSTGRVIIRDTVVISLPGPAVRPGSGRMSSASADTPFVAPYGGILHIYDAQYPPNIYKRSANPPSSPPQLPDSSYLIVELADSTHEFLVSSYFGQGQSVLEQWHVCGPLMQNVPTWYYEAATGWAVGRVHAGDTVRFTFHGEYVNPPEEIFGPFGDSVWLVILDTPRPPGCDEPNDGPEWCQFYVKILPDSVELEIIVPIGGTIDSNITAEPSMPQIKTKARLRNYSGGDVFFDWKFVLKWVNPQYSTTGTRLEDRVIRDSFEGKDTVQNADTSVWVIPWGDLIRGGDIDTLYVTARAGTQTFRDTVINPYRIRGINPVRDSVKAGLLIPQQVVVFRESNWRQFNGSPGFPLYGAPRGYGLMQLDNPSATDQQVWHWRENRARGITLLADKYAEAVGLGARIRNGQSRQDWYPVRYANATDLTSDEQLWKETFQRYRGGSYWRWRPLRPRDPLSTGSWVADPQQGHNRGGEDWQTYQDVLNGNPPPGW